MNQLDNRDEQTPRRWRSRLVQERLDLSLSVKETLATPGILGTHAWDESESDEEADFEGVAKGPAIIRPRLSLQSKAMPAVRPSTSGGALPVPMQAPIQPPVTPQKPYGLPQTYGINTSTRQLIVQPSAALQEGLTPSAGIDALPLARSSEMQVLSTQPAQKKRRSVGRTTKVRLQAAPLPEETRQFSDIYVSPPVTAPTSGAVPVSTLAVLSGNIHTGMRGELSGSAVFKRGQSDLTLSNSRVTATSVVLVMLTEDPGPVVVQYVSLQPHEGFTIHLSAPAQKQTTCNYVILLGELF